MSELDKTDKTDKMEDNNIDDDKIRKELKKKLKEEEKLKNKLKVQEKEEKRKLDELNRLAKKEKEKDSIKENDEKKEKKTKKEVTFDMEVTPHGEKKSMKSEMASAYHPRNVEASWDAYWEKSGFYTANNEDTNKEKFVMVIPPPNVTGTLHLGHALTCAIEDCITRWHRMQGHTTLWVPGTDHAGIATQVIVEKKLKRERGVGRHDLGREKFLEEVWNWKEEYIILLLIYIYYFSHGRSITTQLRRLGTSVDWSREAFTMDKQCGAAVVEAFIRLFNDGLMYRSNRLVNWSCSLRTAISDIEVDYIDLAAPKKLVYNLYIIFYIFSLFLDTQN